MMLFTYEATGNDGIISPIFGGMGYVDRVAIQGQLDIEDSNYDSNEGKGKLLTFMTVGLTNLLKYMGWVLIPTFVFYISNFLCIFFIYIDEIIRYGSKKMAWYIIDLRNSDWICYVS